jgi:AbrB family looped-hinge helix DNA binding protein
MQKPAEITSKGRITVPVEVRRALGVRAGDRLIFEQDEGGVRITANSAGFPDWGPRRGSRVSAAATG